MIYRFEHGDIKKLGDNRPSACIPFVDNELIITVKQQGSKNSIIIACEDMTKEFFRHQFSVWVNPLVHIYVRSRNSAVLRKYLITMVTLIGGIRKGVWVALEPSLNSGIKLSSDVIATKQVRQGFYNGRIICGNQVFSTDGRFIGLLVDNELKRMSATDIAQRRVFPLNTIVKER